MQESNTKVMREALEHVEKLANEFAAGNYYVTEFPKMLLDAILPALSGHLHNGDVGTSEGQCDQTAKGNVATLREALDKLLKWVEIHTAIFSLRVAPIKDDPETVKKEKEDAVAMARAALSAPLRNCDLYATEAEAYRGWEQYYNSLDHLKDDYLDYEDWLFEKAGGK